MGSWHWLKLFKRAEVFCDRPAQALFSLQYHVTYYVKHHIVLIVFFDDLSSTVGRALDSYADYAEGCGSHINLATCSARLLHCTYVCWFFESLGLDRPLLPNYHYSKTRSCLNDFFF